MAELAPADAIRRTRALFNLPETAAGVAHRVRRLDAPDAAYFIVQVGDRVACLDARTGDLASSARSSAPLVAIAREEALRRAGGGPRAAAELVWAPGALSLSMLDPVWAVTDGGVTRYVDQRGRTSSALDAKRPGGG
jgi:hypothetical protein